MKKTLIKYYKNEETVKSKSFFLHKTGFLNKKQIGSSSIKSKTLQQS